MKPELEQRLEEEYEEAALAEMEAKIQKTTPYRENADLSYELDIPRDVSGLIELLEDKSMEKEKEDLSQELDSLRMPYQNRTNMKLISGIMGIVPGTILASQGITPFNSYYYGGGMILMGIGTILGVFGSLIISGKITKSSEKYKEFERKTKGLIEKIKKINEDIKKFNLDKKNKLSCYEKRYNNGDIVLVNDSKLGYSLTTYDIDPKKIISVITHGRDLSADDLRAYLKEDSLVPIICRQHLSGNLSNYGFIKDNGNEEYFTLSIDARREYTTSRVKYEN